MSRSPASPADEARRAGTSAWTRRAPLLALVALVALVYANALRAPFHFDDFYRIVQDEALHRFQLQRGYANRPVLYLSLAVEYALFGASPLAFRVVNVAVHAAAALLLFGLVRRTLAGPRLARSFGAVATPLAFAVAALWAVHPLQTQAVTYIWQRGESMMGMFFLATLYCTARLAEDGGRRWGALALAAFFAGLGTKEVMVSVAPVLLLYDGVLLAPSFRAALRRRWWLYAVMGATLAVGAIYVLPRTHTTLGKVGRASYALSQPGVLLDYLRLSVWPHPLSFDPGRAPARGLVEIVPPLAAIAALLAASVWGLAKRAWWGVAGAWFFLALAPTSSFIPINDLMVEYRMYLPLAGVTALVVALGWKLCARARLAPAIALAAGVVALGLLTVRRNHDYRSNLALWRTVVETSPDCSRGHDMYGVWLGNEGDYAAAEEHARKAVELDPGSDSAHWNLGTTLRRLGRLEEALEHYRRSLELDPSSAHRCAQTAELELQLGRVQAALRHYRRAIGIEPANARHRAGLAAALMQRGKYPEAKDACERALERDPLDVEAWRLRARLAALTRSPDDAYEALRRIAELEPADVANLVNLGMFQITRQELDAAVQTLDRAMALDPAVARGLSAQARSIASSSGEESNRALALRLCERAALRTGRRDAGVLAELARVQALTGRGDLARATFDELLALPELAADPARREALEAERDALRPGGG